MQALYSFFQGGDDKLDKAGKLMMHNTEKIYDLYIHQLSVLIEIRDVALGVLEGGKAKYFPTDQEKNPVMKFVNNRVIRYFDNNNDFRRHFEALRINWADDKELFRRLFYQIRETEEYKEYMSSPKDHFEEDRRFVINLFKDHIADHEELQQIYEERNIFWADDYDIVSYMIIKTMNGLSARMDEHEPLPGLFLKAGEGEEDELEDKSFMLELFRKTILNAEKYDQWIAEKAENWELERIAFMDNLLLRMALCELISFPSIPVKVTMNEYIEISKIYSTAKSRLFINGVLDKLIVEMKEKKLIRKSGRGLLED